ncbi:MAG: preprotein translocase subunit YajC [Rhodospirillaceae bacterium]
MFISTAYAQAASGGAVAPGFELAQLVPLVLIFAVFYFFVIRPQQAKMKLHKSMCDALRRGDRIITAGGIIGTVTRVSGDDEVTVEIAEGVRIRIVRSTIATVVSKTEPTAEEPKK